MFDVFKKLFSQEGKEKDPVCRMNVDPGKTQFSSSYNGRKYYFCSQSCKDQFDANPGQYTG